jgi:hypothetical protein
VVQGLHVEHDDVPAFFFLKCIKRGSGSPVSRRRRVRFATRVRARNEKRGACIFSAREGKNDVGAKIVEMSPWGDAMSARAGTHFLLFTSLAK